MIFEIVEYIIMEWTMPNMQEDTYPKKKKSVVDQFATVKYRSETYSYVFEINEQ